MDISAEELQALVAGAVQGVLEAQSESAEGDEVGPSGITSTVQFFHEYFAPLFARDMSRDGNNWCSRWTDHQEALHVMEGLWSSWEVLRLDPAMGMAVWTRDYAYPLLDRLFNPIGTFANCSAQDHRAGKVLPLPG